VALNLKNPEVESLAAEVAKRTGETKTEAIRVALLERKARLAEPKKDFTELRRFLEQHWATLPPGGLKRPTREEEDEILGYGPNGY